MILKFTRLGRRFYMDIYHTIEEKYLQAIDELNYGDSPKALRLLNEIVANDPTYARAHYQLGLIYYYNIEDYNAAGYHFKLCIELEPEFPDVYYHYLKLIVFLNKSKLVVIVAAQALKTPGVDSASVHNMLGLHAEKNRNWDEALKNYRDALLETASKKTHEDIEESIARVKGKQILSGKYNYQLS